MTKAPPVQTFEISCEVEVHNLGPAMVALAHIEGLTVTGSKLVTTVKSFKQNSPKTDHHIKAEDYLTTWMADHPTFRAREAVKHFKADGRTSGACYTALRVMSSDGRLRKLGEGMYQRPDIKALAKLPKLRDKKAAKPKRLHDIGGGDFALRLMSRNHGKMSSSTMKGHFEKDGRSPTGVGPVLSKLLEDKRIKRVGEGLYELTPKKTDKPKRLNGGEAVVEASANG
jgi:hypothetical protein